MLGATTTSYDECSCRKVDDVAACYLPEPGGIRRSALLAAGLHCLFQRSSLLHALPQQFAHVDDGQDLFWRQRVHGRVRHLLHALHYC